MKALRIITLATLLVSASLAQATTWTAVNKSGGKIVLTNRPCSVSGSKLREAYAFSAGGTRVAGCWAIFDDMVQVIWLDDGKRSVFSVENFTPKEEAAPVTPSSNL